MLKSPGMNDAMQMGGGALDALGQIDSAFQAKKAGRYNARQLVGQGKEQFAVAQRVADETRRQGGLVGSRARTIAAASGTSGGDLLQQEGDIAAQTEYEALARIYEGKVAQRNAFLAADEARREGRKQYKAGLMSAGKTLLTTFASL
jgi:hypothetical protein